MDTEDSSLSALVADSIDSGAGAAAVFAAVVAGGDSGFADAGAAGFVRSNIICGHRLDCGVDYCYWTGE